MSAPISVSFLPATQHDTSFWLTVLTGSQLVDISYVARRGESDEEGAVQRLLNQSRISGIRDFLLSGGTFPAAVVLNWTNDADRPLVKSKQLVLPRKRSSAQIIDGQHRISGLAAAIKEDKSLGTFPVPVTLYDGLTTQQCADIFLSINTEQKPVPRSLVFDLYTLASDYIADPAAVRAGDLAKALNEASSSPYRNFIKFPGAPRGQKGVALSTVVSAVKPLVEDRGVFEQVGLTELHMQTQFLINFFRVLRTAYGIEWDNADNAFRTAAGFTGAIEFVKNRLVVHCNLNGDFTEPAIAKVMSSENLIVRRDVIEGLQGRRAFSKIAEALENAFDPASKKVRKIRV